MAHVVVHATPHDIFYREPSLVCPVELTEHIEHLDQRICFFHRHKSFTLRWGRGVDAEGDVNLRALDESSECIDLSDARHRDSFRAPRESPRGCHYFNRAFHGLSVVHRLTHTHEHYVGEPFGFVHHQDLIDDLCRGQVAVESLPSGHAEAAVHLASGL